VQIEIRKATDRDIPEIQHLLQEVGLSSDGLRQFIDHFFVAISHGQVVGTIGLEVYTPTGLLRSAAVLPAFQHQGIGDQLTARLINSAKELGLNELVLMTTTASAYFSRKGFSAVDRNQIRGEILQSSQFQGGCPSTAVSMRMSLVNA
jgi:amino-acid N-acetyltransferase